MFGGLRSRKSGVGNAHIPFDMFDVEREADTARRAAKLQNIYHRGQDLAWDGRTVLAELIDKHGGVHIDEAHRASVGRIFTRLMWGELAAWKISAQLADRLVPLEAKLAATSQAHDEARHFYVLHDYLTEVGISTGQVDPATRAMLEMVLRTDSLLEKITGMHLMLEILALTIFQLVREQNLDPVLTELLKLYEKDEARHVGLGLQHLPELIRDASTLHNARAVAFQVRMTVQTLRGLKALEPDFNNIGVPARRVLQLGRNKMFTAQELLWEGMGGPRPPSRQRLEAGIDSLIELMFPLPNRTTTWRARLSAARAVWRAGGTETEMVDLAG